MRPRRVRRLMVGLTNLYIAAIRSNNVTKITAYVYHLCGRTAKVVSLSCVVSIVWQDHRYLSSCGASDRLQVHAAMLTIT